MPLTQAREKVCLRRVAMGATNYYSQQLFKLISTYYNEILKVKALSLQDEDRLEETERFERSCSLPLLP